jgi:hypothetical protein
MTDRRELRQGDRVLTPGGRATVAYVRMAAPDYCEPEAVSVVLDRHRSQGYIGTIYLAAQVEHLPRCTSVLDREWQCTAAVDHVGPHRHGGRAWSGE